MKKFSILLFCWCFVHAITGFAQTVIINDGFEDGNFTSNPAWSGDTADFAVVNDTPNYLLQLNAASAGPSYLSTPSTGVNGMWEFYIDFRGFEPSGSNQANIFLMSDIANLKGAVNGYAVQVGQSGDDIFKIVRYDGGTQGPTVVSDTTVVSSNGGGYTVKVTRDNTGSWQIAVGSGYGGPLYDSGNTGNDNTHSSSSYFGTNVSFTSSRSDKFFFDFKIDLPPFTITKAKADGNKVDVAFNRAYDQSTVQASDFSIDNGVGTPSSISFPATDTVRLSYSSVLPSDSYTVTAQNIQSQDGKNIESNAAVTFVVFADFTPGDVIINEFVYDPASNQSEYVELKNLTGKYLNLQNWQIGDDSGDDVISINALTLQPNGFLVISGDTTTLFNTYGSRNYIQPGSAPSFNDTGGDVVKILTNSGSRVDSLQYDETWGGSGVALERRSDTAPSVYKENFGDSPNALGGTPGHANEVADDTTPPGLDNLIITNNQTLDLDFSERLDQTNATTTSNYSLDNGITINNAQQTAGDSVRLSLGSPLQNGTTYHLTITNQQDIFANTAASIDTSFTYYVVSAPDSGDVFINEFTYDPPSGSTEYIELYNPTSKSLDLNGWTLNDNSGNRKVITNTRFVIPPDSFAVLAPDNTLLTNYSNINLANVGSNFPSLNNTGEEDIVIRDSTGVLLDSLQYTPDWGGSGVALERRTINAAAFKANFGDAPNGFGTPGSANQVPPDTTPPDITAFSILDNQSLEFVFTEQVDQASATNTSNYSISGGLNVNSATLSGGDTVRVGLSGALQNNTHYTATVNGVEDRFGNAIANKDTSFTYYIASPADSGDVFINEFTYDPPDQSTEYVELYNTSSKSLDLKGWTLNDNTGNRKTITSSRFIIPPDSFVVIAANQDILQHNPGIALVSMGSSFPSLNNNGDNIVVRKADGTLLDSLTYTSAFGGNNVAVERRSTQAPPVQANFGDAPNGFGTPGIQNQIGQDTTPPRFTDLTIQNNNTLKLAFSEDLKSGPATNAGNYTLTHGITISSATQTAGDSVRLNLNSPLQNAVSYQLTIQNQQDIFGNTASSADTTFTYYKTTPADSGDVFINEFTYDPPEGSTEYVELYNTSSKSLNLQNWTINDNTEKRNIITDSRFIIPPDSFAVLAPDQTLLEDHPGINLLALGSRFPSLNNSGDNIVIRRADGALLDSLTYTSAFGGKNEATERRTTSVAPVQSNFGDAPNGFGTPGSQNEIAADTTPPALADLMLPDRQTIVVAFTESVEKSEAGDAGNYTLDHGINISGVQQTANDSVRLSLISPLQNGVSYNLSISNQQDIFGNTATSIDTTFQFTPDTIPPRLVSFTIPDNKTLKLAFSEDLKSGPATTAGNYTLNHGITINSAVQTAGDSVRLSLSGPLQNAVSYQLSIKKQQDIFGNTAASINTTFTYYKTTPADSADVFINEFTYDPPTGSTEYVELYNTSSKSLDLNGWTINDNTGKRNIITNSRFIIPPDSFAVLAPDQTLLTDHPGINLLTLGSRFPSLNNSGDAIVIRRADGALLDSLTYTPAFGGKNKATERRTTSVAPVPSNFGDAPNGFGTPGSPNQIGKDTTPPGLADLIIKGRQTLELAFTEGVSKVQVSKVGNYVLDHGIKINNVLQTADDSVRLSLSSSLQNGVVYKLSILKQKDIFGNIAASIDTTFQVTADTTGPGLATFTIPDNQTLKLAFSEDLKSGPAMNSGNYTLNHGISINSATQTAGDSVRLSLSAPLQNTVSYQLTITHQQDTFDNLTTSIDTVFTYYKTTPADSADVFINEFTYDPPTGSTEYVELYNTSSKSLDLNGWTINDNTGKQQTITSSPFVIPPDSFAVLAPDQTLLTDHPGINLLTLGSRFPSLNNSGDAIVIRRADGALLDSLTYTTDFGGKNKATERRTTTASPTQANFGDAPNGFGTPGRQNEIAADTTPPVFKTLRILDESKLQLIFSESIRGNTATDASNYSISPGKNIQLISAIADTVTLFLSQPLQSDQAYSVTVQNLQDVFGNTIAKTTKQVTFVKISQAHAGDIVINEVLYAGDPEFVELYNRTSKNFDLSGWKLGDASNTVTIEGGTKLPAGGYVVLTGSSTLASTLPNALYFSNFPSYNGDEDAVYIQNENSTTIDSLFYSAAFGGTIDGISAERKDPAGPANDASNFASSIATSGSTPGTKNTVFMLDTTPPEVVFSKLLPDNSIQVQFDEFIASPDSATFLLNDQQLSIASFDPENGNILFLHAPAGIKTGSDLTITAQNLQDAEGNKTASTQINVAQPLQPGDVVINEIMYDPISNSDDNLPDQSEYLELRNTRDFAISLEGITLHDAPDENGSVRTLTPVNTDAKYIPSQGTALIYAEDGSPIFEQSRIEQFFNIQNTSSSTLIRVDRSSLSLASSGDAIYLALNNATIDSVFYDETWQNPNLADTKGIALERINPAGPGNTKDNWGSSTDPRGGTPNRENTLFQTPGEINQNKVSIKISPNPFSPDGDGRDETTTISYNLAQPDYLLTVDIYDRYGRFVRKLADSKPAGIKGSLIWDGLKDDGSTNRIGIYIVIFKAYDSANGNNVAFKKTVVLARRLH